MVVEEIYIEELALCENCSNVIFNFHTRSGEDDWMHLNGGIYEAHCPGSPVATPKASTVQAYVHGKESEVVPAPDPPTNVSVDYSTGSINWKEATEDERHEPRDGK